MATLDPAPEHRFAFGLWTIGHPGRDPFGDATRPPIDPVDFVRGLADIGAWGVSFHDDDLMTFGAPESQRRTELDRFIAALNETGIVCSMATTNLFYHPIFKDGAFTSNDRSVRRCAVAKVMRNLDVAAELGAPTYVMWGGREGVESAASKEPRDALDRYREALNFLCAYVRDKGYAIRFALEPKPNEPRGDTVLPTVGHALAFIETLDYPDMVGLNPEVAHETMAGLSFYQGVAQTLWQGKLFHIDLNDQKIGRYDQDLRFGSEDQKGAFLLVRLLEGTLGGARYTGPRHFDAHAYRSEDEAGVWEFAKGCMRTYKILAHKAAQFDADPEVKQRIAELRDPAIDPLLAGGYSRDKATALRQLSIDVEATARRGLGYERLDQLLVEHLLGVRGQ
jgi:xylose isomerase